MFSDDTFHAISVCILIAMCFHFPSNGENRNITATTVVYRNHANDVTISKSSTINTPYTGSNIITPRPTSRKPQRKKCVENNYFATLKTCKEDCNGTFNPEDGNPTPTTNVSNKYSYKLVILQKNEYTESRNGVFQTQLGNNIVFKSHYITKGKEGKIYICIPMEESFRQCKKWSFDPEEYEVDKNRRSLWVPSHKKHYNVTEHIIRPQDNIGVACVIPETPQKRKKKTALLVAWFLSLIALGATIILAFIFPALNLKNKILLCNFIMLFIAYATLSTKLLLVNLGTFLCKFLAHLQQYAFLSAFCWINIQAVDVFLRFVHLRLHSADSSEEKKRFIIYAVHGWSTPLWITLITVIVEAAGVKYLNPMIASECWFQNSNKAQAFLYFYGPISVILLVNTTLFIITIYKLCTMGKGSNNLKKGLQKQLFQVYMKLIVVMGLCWIMEVISVIAGGDDRRWIFTDMINALQGLFVFIVYVCKPSFLKKVFNNVYKNPGCPSCWPLKPHPESSNQDLGRTTASTTNNDTLKGNFQTTDSTDNLRDEYC